MRRIFSQLTETNPQHPITRGELSDRAIPIICFDHCARLKIFSQYNICRLNSKRAVLPSGCNDWSHRKLPNQQPISTETIAQVAGLVMTDGRS